MQEINQTVSQVLNAQRDALAQAITDRHYESNPELANRYGAPGRAKCLQDARYHLSYLAESVRAAQPALFADYIAWVRVMLAGRNIPASDLAQNLECLREVLYQMLPEGLGALASEYVETGLRQLPQLPAAPPPAVADGAPLGGLARQYLNALLAGERRAASRLILDAVAAGTGVKDLYLHVFQPSQHEIGRLWQMNQLSVAQEHYCTAATQLIMSQLYPYVFASEKNGLTLVATCVAGDLHEIGIRMVADFFELEGWDTFYLGANAPAGDVVRTVSERRADVLAASATMTFHIPAVAELIQAVRSSKVGGHIKILVGGYPFNIAPDLWREVGADAYATDAEQSVAAAARLVAGGGRS